MPTSASRKGLTLTRIILIQNAVFASGVPTPSWKKKKLKRLSNTSAWYDVIIVPASGAGSRNKVEGFCMVNRKCVHCDGGLAAKTLMNYQWKRDGSGAFSTAHSHREVISECKEKRGPVSRKTQI